MPKFKCNTKGCPDEGITELIPRIMYTFDTELRTLVSDKDICKECGKQREQLSEGSITSLPWFKADNDRNNNNKKIKKFN